MHYILSSPRSGYGYSNDAKSAYTDYTGRDLDTDLPTLSRSDGNLVRIIQRLGVSAAAGTCTLQIVEVQDDIGLHPEVTGDGGAPENDKLQINGVGVTLPLNSGCPDAPMHGAALEAWCSDRSIPYPYTPE